MDKDVFNYTKEFQQIKTEFKKIYQSIYDNISDKFTKIPDDKIIELQENIDLNISILRVLVILSETYNLSPRLMALDFQYEIDRLTKLGDFHPEIETFWIRLAIEEASWFVILRVEFPNRLRTRIQKLLNLEETIWQKKSAEVEDGVYYLIETLNVGNTWIAAIIDLWNVDHLVYNSRETVELFCAFFYNAPITRKNQILNGATRTLKSRIKDLNITEDLNVNTDFKNIAMKYKQSLKNELSEENEEKGSFTYQYPNDVMYAILLETILQKLIRQKKKSARKI